MSAAVSVVIPCFNHARFLGEAIRSALEQSHRARDVVVIDDGSTDDTPGVAAGYPRVHYLRQANAGLAAARNAGLRASTGRYVVFLDADDRLLPQALAAGLAALAAAPTAACAYGGHLNIDLEGRRLVLPAPPRPRGDPYLALLESNVIPNPATVIYRRWVFDVVGVFDTTLRAAEDYDLYLRIARRFTIVSHERPVCEYRRYRASMSGNLPLMLATTLRVLYAQRPWIAGDLAREAAWRRGLTGWRETYGRPLTWQVSGNVEQRRWRQAVAGTTVLARHAPALVARAMLRALLRRSGLRPAQGEDGSEAA